MHQRTELLFITSNFDQKDMIEPLGISILAAITKKAGIKTDIIEPSIDGYSWEMCAEYVENLNPIILGISMMFSYNIDKVIKLVERLKVKMPELHIIVGGKAISFYYETIDFQKLLTKVDAFFIGDSEYNLPQYVNCVLASKKYDNIQGICYIKDGELVTTRPARKVEFLDELPWQDRTVLEEILRKDPDTKIASIIYGRGCNYNCTFCCFKKYENMHENKTSFIRRRTIDNLFEEIKFLVDKYDIDKFTIEDESFLDTSETCRNNIDKLCELLATIPKKLSFDIIARVDSVDKEICEKIIELGVSDIFVGVDSVIEYDLKLYNKRYSADIVYKGLKCILNAGYSIDLNAKNRLKIGYITWNPYSTIGGLKETYEFFKKYGVTPKLIMNSLVVDSAIPIKKKIERDGLLGQLKKGNTYDWKFQDPDVEHVYLCMEKYYSTWFKIREIFRYCEKYLQQSFTAPFDICFVKHERENIDEKLYNIFGLLLNESSKEKRDSITENEIKWLSENYLNNAIYKNIEHFYYENKNARLKDSLANEKVFETYKKV